MICLSSAGSLRWPQVGCWSLGLPRPPYWSASVQPLAHSLSLSHSLPLILVSPTLPLWISTRPSRPLSVSRPTQTKHALPPPTLSPRHPARTLSFVPLEGAGAGCLCIRYCYDTAPRPATRAAERVPGRGPREVDGGRGGMECGSEDRGQTRGERQGERD